MKVMYITKQVFIKGESLSQLMKYIKYQYLIHTVEPG